VFQQVAEANCADASNMVETNPVNFAVSQSDLSLSYFRWDGELAGSKAVFKFCPLKTGISYTINFSTHQSIQ
jgi:hypothetical protein